MARHTDRRSHRLWRTASSAKTRALLSLGLLVGFGSIGTYAYWSDTAVVSGGAITSGTMDLQFDVGQAVGTGANYQKTTITWNGLAPGERKAFNLKVNNVGNPPFTYAASVTRGATPAWTFVGTPITVQIFTGTSIPDTTYPQQESCSGTSVGVLQSVDGNNKPVITTPREVAAGASENLCIVVGLATTATSDNQGKTGSIALTFTANQKSP